MKLLPKQQDVQRQKILERKTEIDEGAKLAKKIDDLRQTHALEKARLEKFRDESLKAVKDEITSIIAEREERLKELEHVEEEIAIRKRKLQEFYHTK